MIDFSTYVAILDVGHGNCTVIKDKENVSIIDCGSNSSGLLEFLALEQISEIDKIYISHSDQDHIGGLIGLLSSNLVNIKEIIVNADATKKSNLWDDLAYELSCQNEKGKIIFTVGISRSKVSYFCGNIEVKTTGPSAYIAAKGVGGKDFGGRTINSNSGSASFHILWNSNPLIYLAGDIDEIGLDDLIQHKADLNAKILVFPHHGGKSSTINIEDFTNKIYGQVNPEIVLFSIGRKKFKNPRPEIVKSLRALNNNIRISCTQLSENCKKNIDPNKKLNHLVNSFSKGIEKNFCCSGTFILNLSEDVSIFPEYDSHLSFIKDHIETPLCIN